MRAWPVLLLLLLPLFPTASPAQTVIHRCVAGDGHPVFTDRTCAALHAVPTAPAEALSSEATAPSTAPVDRPAPVTCAADADQLRQAVIEALAAQDANRLAGLILWEGYGRHAALTDIRALGELASRPLVDVGLAATGMTANDYPDDGSATELVVTTAGDLPGSPDAQTRFALVREAGCLWLRQQ